MSRRLTASDRRSLIRLASGLPVGSDERRAILAGLRRASGRRVYEQALRRESKLKHYTDDDYEDVAYAMDEWNDHRDVSDYDELLEHSGQLMTDIEDVAPGAFKSRDYDGEVNALISAFARARNLRKASAVVVASAEVRDLLDGLESVRELSDNIEDLLRVTK